MVEMAQANRRGVSGARRRARELFAVRGSAERAGDRRVARRASEGERVSEPSQRRPPRLIDGRYRVDRHVADGAFGSVYAGRHLTLDAPVAIKILRVARTADPATRAELASRLLEEGRTLMRLRHPNVVGVTDLGLLPPEPD